MEWDKGEAIIAFIVISFIILAMKLSVIIPVYNEVGNIEEILKWMMVRRMERATS
jgi:hypothetical protein